MMQLYQELKYGTIKPQINFAPAFPTPALRKRREERGTHCVVMSARSKARTTRPGIAVIADIAVIGKAQNLPLINTDDERQNLPRRHGEFKIG